MHTDVKIGLFAYNFPHRKTQEFLFTLLGCGYEVGLVLAAEPVKLKIPPATVRTKLRHTTTLHPADIAKNLDVPYEVVPHNSERAVNLTHEYGLELGVIGGARILKEPIIDAFLKGIINYHPGMIPEARGLDALLWSIRNDVPLGVTAHLIDKRVDAGVILEKREIPVYADDTIFDLSERLYETQVAMIPDNVGRAVAGNGTEVGHGSKYNRKMSAELGQETMGMVQDYIARHAARQAETRSDID